VINRGNDRRDVFLKDGDYQAFLKAMGHACIEIPMPVLAGTQSGSRQSAATRGRMALVERPFLDGCGESFRGSAAISGERAGEAAAGLALAGQSGGDGGRVGIGASQRHSRRAVRQSELDGADGGEVGPGIDAASAWSAAEEGRFGTR